MHSGYPIDSKRVLKQKTTTLQFISSKVQTQRITEVDEQKLVPETSPDPYPDTVIKLAQKCNMACRVWMDRHLGRNHSEVLSSRRSVAFGKRNVHLSCLTSAWQDHGQRTQKILRYSYFNIVSAFTFDFVCNCEKKQGK